jgi:hypothetical protein
MPAGRRWTCDIRRYGSFGAAEDWLVSTIDAAPKWLI